MSLKEFDKTFGLDSSLDEEKKKFVNRIEGSVFNETNKLQYIDKRKLYELVCVKTGDNFGEIITKWSNAIPGLQELTKGDFHKTMKVVMALYECYSTNSNMHRTIDSYVKIALDCATLPLGIEWKDGIFYPSGDEFLDKELIETSLDLLEKFPEEKKDLKIALEHYWAKRLDGVIENCYKAMEGLGRKILNNNNRLDKNYEALLERLQFSNYWKDMYSNYLKFAHEYRRHAGKYRHNLNPEEVEGFLYLTCIMIRATVKAKERANLRTVAPRDIS